MAKRVHQTDRRPDGTEIAWPRPLYDRGWTDGDGTTWTMRGGELDAKAAGRLIRRPGVLVLHAYHLDVAMVEGREKDALLHRVGEFLKGRAPEFSLFELGEFRDQDRRIMLVVQESC